MNCQRLILENLSTIDRVVSAIARRHRLASRDQDEFRSLVRLRLLEDDCRVLRAFENRSSLSTYLTIVISRIFLDFRNQEWGRWRPSAQARRLGPTAILLDKLMTRDGHQIDEAIEILRTNYRVPMSDTEIRALWDSLPRRIPTKVVGEEAAHEVAGANEATAEVEFSRRADARARVGEALSRAFGSLAERDRLIVQLHFGHGVRVTDIAAHLGMSKATLHRHVSRIVLELRAILKSEQFHDDEIAAVLRSGSLELPDLFDASTETVWRRARLFSRDE